MKLSRLALALLIMLAAAAGCGTKSEPAAPPPPSTQQSTSAAPAAMTERQFDPRWMTVAAPPRWTESERRITSDFQQFGLRPTDENEMPRRCNGCGVEPPTAFLTAYAAGKFDPTQARTGEQVKVAAADGFLLPSQGLEDAVLAWQYADNAWATVRGRTSITSQPDRMIELAASLRPDQRTAVRVPLSMPALPNSLSLAQINVDRGRYGTTIEFAPCGRSDVNGANNCGRTGDYLRVQIWPDGDPASFISGEGTVPAQIDGRNGIYAADGKNAAVQVQPGMVAVFNLDADTATPALKDLLAGLSWAPDPADEQTWPAVADWTTPN